MPASVTVSPRIVTPLSSERRAPSATEVCPAPLPSALLWRKRNSPAATVVTPPYVLAPARVSMPAPFFVSPNPLPPSPMMPLTVRVLVVMVSARLPVNVIAPVPRSRLRVPMKVKFPAQLCGMAVVMARSDAEVLLMAAAPSRVVIVKRPVPNAVALFKASLPPPLYVSPPLQLLFIPESANVSVVTVLVVERPPVPLRSEARVVTTFW